MLCQVYTPDYSAHFTFLLTVFRQQLRTVYCGRIYHFGQCFLSVFKFLLCAIDEAGWEKYAGGAFKDLAKYAVGTLHGGQCYQCMNR